MNIVEAYKKKYNVKNKKGNLEISFSNDQICLSIKSPNENTYCGYYTVYKYFNKLSDFENNHFNLKDLLDILADDWEVVE